MNDKMIVVLYHADCLDGYASAWAAWKIFADKANYIAVKHDSPLPPFPEGATLYIVDFCYPFNELVLATKKAEKIIILDHHISAQKDFEAYKNHSIIPDNLEVNFVQEHSGCVIVWQYFQGTIEVPKLLQHIEDNDIWLHKLPKTKEICKALYLHFPVPFSEFESIELATLQQEGVVLEKQQQLNVSRLLKAQHRVTLNNIGGLAVNAPSMFSSDLGHELAKQSGTFGLTYIFHGKYQLYHCGLRSIGDFDVSQIAKLFGGGGHKNAAGFRVDQSTFLHFLE